MQPKANKILNFATALAFYYCKWWFATVTIIQPAWKIQRKSKNLKSSRRCIGLHVKGSGVNRLQTLKGIIFCALAGTEEFISKVRGLKF